MLASRIGVVTVWALATVAIGSLAQAQGSYPNQIIRIVVPYAPGGSTDILSRLLAESLREKLRQTIVVENRPGGGATIGSSAVVKAAADGYTLLMSGPATYLSPLTQKNPTYAPLTDFSPVGSVAQSGGYLFVNAALPVQNIKELIEYARANPGKLNYASAGAASLNHLAMELFNERAGTKMVHVPFAGGLQHIQSVATGEVQVMILDMGTALPFVQSGKVRAIAQAGIERSPLEPDLPTISESGLPGFDAGTWFGVVGPKGIPQDIVLRLNNDINAAITTPTFIERLRTLSMDNAVGTPQSLGERIKKLIETWDAVIKRNNLNQQ